VANNNNFAPITGDYVTINIGPSHPAMHGTLRVVCKTDGETIVEAIPEIGYLHRGVEKLGENLTYHQFIPITDRLNYCSAIANNIAYNQEFNEEKIKEALKKVHLWEFVKELNNGIHTMLMQKGKSLSEIQKQQMTLARLLYNEPDVLILDEISSSLHPKEQALIQKILKELKSKTITITVTEELNNIKDSDVILVFKEGEIVCRGQHKDLIQECEEYQKLAKVLI